MRKILCLLLLVLAVPAYAGHGTIEETDEGFIVEYSGDASDKATTGGAQMAPGSPQTAPGGVQVAGSANRATDAQAAQSPSPDGDPRNDARNQARKGRAARPRPRSSEGANEE